MHAVPSSPQTAGLLNTPRERVWLGVYLPRIAIEAFPEAAQGSPDARAALAVCERGKVLHANPPALAAGVARGTAQASAQALCHQIILVERDHAREADLLRQAACVALQFTPAVSLERGSADETKALANGGAIDREYPLRDDRQGLLLDIGPSIALFGGRQTLIARLRAGLSALGLSASISCAPVAAAAWLLALHNDARPVESLSALETRLAALPLRLLDAASAQGDTLAAIGLHTIGDLIALPRAGLARRFGQPLLDAIDRACGRQPGPRLWYQPPPTFSSQLEPPSLIDSTELLLHAAAHLLGRFETWLAARQSGARQFSLLAIHDNAPETRFTVRLADPSREAARLLSVLRESVASQRLRAPAHTLRLECETVSPLAFRSAALFPVPGNGHEGLGRLIERLQARLGPERVQQLLRHGDHRPERASGFRAANASQIAIELADSRTTTRSTTVQPDPPAPAPAAGSGLPRPLWLFPRPTAIQTRNAQPFWHGPLTLLAGPERIESGWWDEELVQRDYFIAADVNAALLWIYREHPRDSATRTGWFIQGRFG